MLVRGGGDLRAAGTDVLDDRDGEGRALDRVGARAQLVEEDEGIAVRLVEDIDNGLHVRGEGGKALLDALLVADVGEDAGKDAHRAAVARRDVQSALRHQAEQTERFETDGLAAGVGACDDEGIEAAAHLNVDGHGLGGIEQRMAGAAEGNAAVRADLALRKVRDSTDLPDPGSSFFPWLSGQPFFPLCYKKVSIHNDSGIQITQFPSRMPENLSAPASAADRKSTRLNSSHVALSRMPSSA